MKNIAFIDAANIILSSQRAGLDIDFLKLKTYLVDKFKVEKIYYFTANLKSLHEELKVLEMNGFSLVLKQVYFENSKTKANCDVEISHYITKMIENNELSQLILLSGDGDFSILLDYANKNNVDVILMPTDVKASSKILRIKKYLKIIFLEQVITKIEKEKTPAST
jgi:uncharacterized LabA/DUF88 family protein